MVGEGWLQASLVLPKVTVNGASELVHAVSEAMARVAQVPSSAIAQSLQESLAVRESYSIGRGVALPHAESDRVSETLVCLVTTRHNLKLPSIDGIPPDVYFFILSKPDPHAHLLLLAHVAKLCHSRTFLQALRSADRVEEVLRLVSAAEKRVPTSLQPKPQPSAGSLILVTVSGEKAVDALLVDLVDQGLGDACIVESQSLREATAHEVPLFASFRDLFGDPGGRRVLLLQATEQQTEAALQAMERVGAEYPDCDIRVTIIPVLSQRVMRQKSATEHPGS